MKVLIEIRGGTLAAVHADTEVEVLFVDWDDYFDDPTAYEPGRFRAEPLEAMQPDTFAVLQRLE